MDYTIDDWRENLKKQREQYADAAHRWTTPRACWFRFDYQEPLTLNQHDEYVKAFMVSVADFGDAADFVLPEIPEIAYENRHYTAALLDGTPE